MVDAYLAGFFDGEGCISTYGSKKYTKRYVRVECANTDPVPLQIFQERFGGKVHAKKQNFVNGYAFAPTDKGLRNLSRNLDLNIVHLRRCINRYLEA